MVMSSEVQERFRAFLRNRDLAGLKALAAEFDIDDLISERGDPPSLLTEAINDRDNDVLQLLLDAGADPNRNEALARAANYGNAQAVHLLLDAGAGPGVAEYLECAVLSGDLATVDELLAHGASPSKRPGALKKAAEFGHVEIVKTLLKAGAEPDWRGSKNNGTPLACACFGKSDEHLECVRIFLSLGADPNSLNYLDSTTPLILASRFGSPQMIRELVKAGADPNLIVDSMERGALFGAVHEGRRDNVKALLDLGADPCLRVITKIDQLKRTGGLTPLELANAPVRQRIVQSIVKLLEGAIAKKPTSTPKVSKSWETIRIAIGDSRDSDSSDGSRLRKGAALDAIRALETKLGVNWPEGFRESYSVCDGQVAESRPFIINIYDSRDGERYRLLSLDEIDAEWRKLKKSTSPNRSADPCARNMSRETGVRSCWWDVGWVPFATNEYSDYLLVDLAPTPSGQRGQVVAWCEGGTRILSPSFAEWIADLAAALYA